MLIEQVTAWLNKPDSYPAGIELLKQTGYKSFTLTILSKSDNTYNRSRVKQELRIWLESQNKNSFTAADRALSTKQNPVPVKVALDYGVPGAKPVIIAQAPAKHPLVSLYKASPNDPADIALIRKQIGHLMDEREEAIAWIRAKEDLGNSPEANAVRFPYAVRVKVNTRAIDELYSRISFFIENGHLPPLASDRAILVDDNRVLLNARSSVSKYKARMNNKKLTPEQRQSARELYEKYSLEKQRLEQKLSNQHDSYSTGQQTSDRPIHSTSFS